MRRVNFLEVGMENFGPYLDPMVLQFNPDTIVLMTGPNGVGKTMSLDAITYTLFGVTSKGAKGDDVVNNIAGKNCKTWVKFNIDNDKYLVTRYRKYTKLNNTVILTKNEVDIKKGHIEVLPEITKLICSQKAFMNTLMFGQKVKDFFTDLVDSDKKLIFREILALELYQSYYKEADKRLKAVKAELDVIEKQQGINHGLNEDAKQQIELLLAAKKRWEQERQDAITELKKSIETNQRLLEVWQEAFKALEKEDIDIDSTISDMSNIEKELSTIQSTLDNELQSIEQQRTNKLLEMQNKANEAGNEINSKYRTEYDRIAKEKAELQETLNDLVLTAQTRRHKLELKAENVESNIRNRQERAKEIQDNVIDAGIAECPTCKQEVSEKTIGLLTVKVTTYNEDISKSFKLVSSIQEQIQELNAEMIKGSKELAGFIDNLKIENDGLLTRETTEIQQLDLRLIEATDKINQLANGEKSKKEIAIVKAKSDLEATRLILLSKKEDQEKAIESRNDTATRIENLKNDIARLENQILDKEKDEHDKTQLNAYTRRLIDLDKTLEQLETKWDVLDGKVQRLEFWKTGFSSSGIPSMLIDEAIPFMNEKVAYYLDKFTNGRYIVSFDTMAATKAGEFRDKISVNVVDTYTRANSRIQLSGGQTRMIDIATILTLGDLQENIQDVSINILLFDEIFDSLDEENIGYVSKVLSTLKFGKSIYLISHRHEDQIEADETLTLH